jgi:pimeloyl-ACP methyl ester carboxylesterase
MDRFPAPTPVRLAPTAGGGGVTLSVHEAGRGPAVVFCHGFPDLAYSWRHQVPALAAAGYRAIAPDQRGYGCLMLTAEWDPALPPALAAGMPARCADLEMHMIERAGHWVQQEYPDAVTARLLAWLPRVVD